MKEEGNRWLASGNFEKAIDCYSEGISKGENLHILHSNRSLAYLKLNSPKKALEDAISCIRLSPLWGKAYSRKGNALFALKMYQEALEAYEEGLAIDGKNSTLIEGRTICWEKLQTNEPVVIDPLSAFMSGIVQLDKKENSLAACTDGTVQLDKKEDPLAAFMSDIVQLDKKEDPLAAFMSDIVQLDKKEDPLAAFMSDIVQLDKKEDPLAAFMDDIGQLDKIVVVKKEFKIDHESEMKGWTSENQIERILQRNHQWINVNPFTVLGLTDEHATTDDITKRYRKLSTMIHPDKTKVPRSQEAFDEVKRGYERLQDDNARKLIVEIIHQCRERVRKTRNRLRKNGLSETDLISRDGTFQESVDKEIKKEFASRELQRQKSEINRRNNEKRERHKEEDELEHWKTVKEYEEGVRETREVRAKTWQGFASKARVKTSKRQIETSEQKELESKRLKSMGIDKTYKSNWR